METLPSCQQSVGQRSCSVRADDGERLRTCVLITIHTPAHSQSYTECVTVSAPSFTHLLFTPARTLSFWTLMSPHRQMWYCITLMCVPIISRGRRKVALHCGIFSKMRCKVKLTFFFRTNYQKQKRGWNQNKVFYVDIM